MTPNINRILSQPAYNASSKYGAQMGRIKRIGDNPAPLYLQRVSFQDGDYDRGGAYWGGYPSPPLYCAFTADESTMIFVRGENRTHAKHAALEILGLDWTFIK